MAELPPVLETVGWEWMSFTAPVAPSNHFWLGTDPHGNRWLTKLRGDFYAYREIVFGRLAQKMAWSCQSTAFLRVSAEAATVLDVKPGSIHAAHWFLDEHVHPPCAPACRLAALIGLEVHSIEDLSLIDIDHILDWPKSEFAACLFGGNEPPGRLFTASHGFVITDSEQMFSIGPVPFGCTSWWGRAGSPRPSAVALAREVCAEFASLNQTALENALTLPTGVTIDERWAIAPLLRQSHEFAHAFVTANT